MFLGFFFSDFNWTVKLLSDGEHVITVFLSYYFWSSFILKLDDIIRVTSPLTWTQSRVNQNRLQQWKTPFPRTSCKPIITLNNRLALVHVQHCQCRDHRSAQTKVLKHIFAIYRPACTLFPQTPGKSSILGHRPFECTYTHYILALVLAAAH